MDDLDLRKKYLDYFKNEAKIFDFEKFIMDDDVAIDNGAVGIITPNEIAFARNIPNKGCSKPGSGSHDNTNDLLTKVLYDLSLENKMFINGSKETEYSIMQINEIKNGQNILIRMINEGYGVIHNRAICIEFPTKITTSQLEFLQYLEGMYGTLLHTIGENMVKKGEYPLIFFQKKDRKNVFCNSFRPAIEYAKENLVDDVKQVIDEKYIIGITKENIYNNEKQI